MKETGVTEIIYAATDNLLSHKTLKARKSSPDCVSTICITCTFHYMSDIMKCLLLVMHRMAGFGFGTTPSQILQ